MVLKTTTHNSAEKAGFASLAAFTGKALPAGKSSYPTHTPHPTSVQVSAAITAYARIAMSRFIDIPGNPPLYSHLDSLYLQYPLSSEIEEAYVSPTGDELGKLMYEGRVTQLAVLGPGNYAYLDAEGGHVVPAGRGLSHAQVWKSLTEPNSLVSYTQSPRITQDIQGEIRVTKSEAPIPLQIPSVQKFITPSNIIVDGLGGSSRFTWDVTDPRLLPAHLKTSRNTRVNEGELEKRPRLPFFCSSRHATRGLKTTPAPVA